MDELLDLSESCTKVIRGCNGRCSHLPTSSWLISFDLKIDINYKTTPTPNSISTYSLRSERIVMAVPAWRDNLHNRTPFPPELRPQHSVTAQDQSRRA